MRPWRATLAITIATLWMVVGAHCLLEVLPGLEFLSCCQHAEAEKSPAHHEKDCGDDGCSTIEAGFYKLEQTQHAPAKPLLLVAWVTPLSDIAPTTVLGSLVSCSSSPPELPRLWQFSQRTALPPRAPSFVS
jgi:hypothetical protein